MPSDSSPLLPPELEREIFEIAAALYPETISNLLLVSHRVYEWIERVKYRTVIPADLPTAMCTIPVLQRAIRSSSKPESFFRDHVHHLFLHHLEDDELEEILSVCSGIRYLVLSHDSLGRLDRTPSLGATRPRRLAVWVRDLVDTMNSPHPHPIFTFVTHLDLFDRLHYHHTVGHLVLLPALTHLALSGCAMSPTHVLARCRTLETLIEMYEPAAGWDLERLQSVNDVRFVAMVVSDEDYLGDWVLGTQGGLDFWARADAFIAKKRRGEIKPGLPYAYLASCHSHVITYRFALLD